MATLKKPFLLSLWLLLLMLVFYTPSEKLQIDVTARVLEKGVKNAFAELQIRIFKFETKTSIYAHQSIVVAHVNLWRDSGCC